MRNSISTGYAFESDRDRDAELLAAGYVTVRITWERLKPQPAREAERLRTILRGRRRKPLRNFLRFSQTSLKECRPRARRSRSARPTEERTLHRSLKRNLVIGLGGAGCGRVCRWRVRRHPEFRSEHATGVPERRRQAPARHAAAAQLRAQRRRDRSAPGRGQGRPADPGPGERARAAAEERRHRAARCRWHPGLRPARAAFAVPRECPFGRGPGRPGPPGPSRVRLALRARPGRRRELSRADQRPAVPAAPERQVAGADRHREGQDRRRPRSRR